MKLGSHSAGSGVGTRLLLLAAAFVANGTAAAQRAGYATDDEIVRRASLSASGELVEVFAHGVSVDPGFLGIAEDAYRRLETLTGRKLETAVLGPKIRIYVSDAVSISHVWRGYRHQMDPKGIVFLNPFVYQAAFRGTNATYAHEMAHLFTWRFRSHTLREGFADWLALQIHPGAGVGPNPNGHDASARIPAEVAEYLGTTRPAPDTVITEAHFRRLYYLASYRFVRFLIERAGTKVFMQLYESDSTEAGYKKLYGATREELLRAAGISRSVAE